MCSFGSSMTCRKILIYRIFAFLASFETKIVFLKMFFAICEIPLRESWNRIWQMFDFGLQMNWNKIGGVEITSMLPCPLASKWRQRHRVNMKVFRGQEKVEVISALYPLIPLPYHQGDLVPKNGWVYWWNHPNFSLLSEKFHIYSKALPSFCC